MAATKQEEEEQILPQDILFEIFTKLPTISVGKCRCLSKLWSIQLSSPYFIKKNVKIRENKSLQLNQENIVLYNKSENSFVVITCPTNKQQESRKYIFPDLDIASYYVFGSYNGLLLLEKNKKMILINPVTLKQAKLPDIATTHNLKHLINGFGYDCVSDEYKVVAVMYYFNNAFQVYVHSVKKGGSWRVVKDVGWLGDNCGVNLCNSGVLLNGALHWEAETLFPKGSRLIAVFDLASESFHKIQSPSKLTRDVKYSRVIMALGGCLCTVDTGGGFVDLWIMKEYGVVESWTNVRIHGDGMWEAITLLCVVGDEKVLGVSNRDKWYLCDLRERTCKEVDVGVKFKTMYKLKTMYAGRFVDSLVDPGQLFNFPKEVTG